MAIKPILFNTKMVRAILDGRKDATRRIVKGFIPDDAVWGYTAFTPKGYISCRGTFADGYGEKFFKLPCESGDTLYVRETWCGLPVNEAGHMRGHTIYYYKADGELRPKGWRGTWHQSIHMPKEAARIWLKVTDVRVERLQEITDEQAKREGIQYDECPTGFTWKQETDMHNCYTTPIGAMQALWNSTIKKSDLDRYGWDANSYVWVIEFERCEKPEGV
jgi:hypothetical protein